MRFYYLKLLILPLAVILFPLTVLGQMDEGLQTTNFREENFKARVKEIISEEEVVNDLGQKIILQDLKLIALSGSRQGEEVLFQGLTNQITTKQTYNKGQVLLVTLREGAEVDGVYIDDVWRVNTLYYLTGLFLIIALFVGRGKGLRAMLSFLLTFVIIFKFTIPFISSGNNPFLITLVSSIFVILISMLLLYGWSSKSKAAMISIIISVFVASGLSYLFVWMGNLTGFGEEEAILLADTFKNQETFSGLLLAAFVLGALGILDDVVLTQISAVEQLKKTNSHLHPLEVYKRAMKIGTDHIASMINTLFLAYASSAFFLMFLIQSKQPPFNNFLETINNEVVATEVVRVLVGSIGLVLAIPIATYIASFYYFKHSIKK